MRTGSNTAESFKRLSEDYVRGFRARYRDASLQLIESHKAALEQVKQFLNDHHETGSAGLSKFIKVLMAGQLEGLKLLRDAEERAFDLQTGMIESYLQMLEQLSESLEGDEPSNGDKPSDS
jgi:hypothetical protein